MKSFQIFNSVQDATILAADTSGLLKDAKVKVSFEFVQYLRDGVFVVVEDLPNWVQNTARASIPLIIFTMMDNPYPWYSSRMLLRQLVIATLP